MTVKITKPKNFTGVSSIVGIVNFYGEFDYSYLISGMWLGTMIFERFSIFCKTRSGPWFFFFS